MKEFRIQTSQPGLTVRGILRNEDDLAYKPSAAAFVAYETADRDLYAVELTEEGTASGRYVGDMPAVPAGDYSFEVFARATSVMLESDEYLGGTEGDPIVWDGTAVVTRQAQASALAGMAEAVWEVVLSGTLTAAKLLRGVAAVLFGKVTADGTEYHEAGGPGDDTDVVLLVTADTDGNREVTRSL